MSRALQWIGGRKFVAFLLVLALVWRCVEAKYLTDETIIRDLLIALLAVFGGVNVGQKVAQWKYGTQPATSLPSQDITH